MPPRTKTAPPKRGRKLARSKESATKDSAPQIGTRIDYDCPTCGRADNNTEFKITRYGDAEWIYGCWTASCPTGGEYLCAVAEAYELSPYASKDEIVAAIMESNGGGINRRGDPEPLPSESSLAGWAAGLLASPSGGLYGTSPLDYLTKTRGLSVDVIEQERIGFDRDRGRLVFPMYRGGELVAAKWRKPRDIGQMRSWAGERAWPMYPEPEPGKRGVLLVAGELDALRGQAVGLPAASVTRGAGNWRDEWTETLRGRRVVVCFDNGEQDQARERVATLKLAGVRASRLDLRSLGLTKRKGDLSDYLNGGGSARAVRAAARRAS